MSVISPCTREELMVVVVARSLRDDDVAFVGLGTGDRGFVLAVGIPIVACRLAQLTNCPNLTLMIGPIVNPDIRSLPRSYTDRALVNWSAEAHMTSWDCLDVFKRGKMTVSFVSGAQVDKYGNLNVVAIGDRRAPKVRLTGCIAQSDHTNAGRNIIMMDLEKRRFVEKVDNVSYAGYLDGHKSRAEVGLRGGGPEMVVTDKAVFGFRPDSKQMFVKSVHPGVCIEDVMAGVSFQLEAEEHCDTTGLPTEEELEIIRTEIDPDRRLLGGTMR
jgi:glutaconate CoA-transferase subunit B